jgi:RNA polymerase sigma-70 factor, ECF subfamily
MALERDEPSWSRLMAAAQDGDRAAYERLLREIVPYIRTVAAAWHRDPDELEEIAQDVLLAVHRVRHTYDPTRPFKPWLAAIARRRAIDYLRRRARRNAVETFDEAAYETFPDPAANRVMAAFDAGERLGPALAALPEQQREAVELLKLRELSLAEAARLSGRSVAALKVNMHRALKSLRKRLAGE